MDLNLQTLTVVVPSDATKSHCPAVIVDSGHLLMVSKNLSRVERESCAELSKTDINKYFFDSYSLQVSDVCVYSVSDVEKWREGTSIYLLPPFNLDLELKVRHVPVLSVPNIVLIGKIPQISVVVDTHQVRDILVVAKGLSQLVPKSDLGMRASIGSSDAVVTRLSADSGLKRVSSCTFFFLSIGVSNG